MDPISNQQFFHDAPKFVYQYRDDLPETKKMDPSKPFKISGIKKSHKSKKDSNKDKDLAKEKKNQP